MVRLEVSDLRLCREANCLDLHVASAQNCVVKLLEDFCYLLWLFGGESWIAMLPLCVCGGARGLRLAVSALCVSRPVGERSVDGKVRGRKRDRERTY